MSRPGSMQINRPLGGKTVTLELTDHATGVQFVTAELTLEDLARALLGSASVPCLVTTRGLELLGKRLETKTVPVPLNGDTPPDELLASYEVDGWRGNTADLTNRNKRENGAAMVTFTRYVPDLT